MGGKQKWAGWEGKDQGAVIVEGRGEGDSRSISDSANLLHSTDTEVGLVHPSEEVSCESRSKYHSQVFWVIAQNTLNI